MNRETVAKRLRDLASAIEDPQVDDNRTDPPFVAHLPDFVFDSLALMWCDGFGPVRPWRLGDPLPDAAVVSDA